MPPVPSPDEISFPSTDSTVSVKALLAFTGLTMAAHEFFSPAPGTGSFDGPPAPWVAPGYAFLVEHAPTKRRVVFDLGIRKDPSTSSPRFIENEGKIEVKIEQDVAEQLQAGGVDLKSVEAIIWSHPHFDHKGDPSTFPGSTALILGPDLKDLITPGYPANPKSIHLTTDYAGREVREITFPADAPQIGGLASHDYFGDGSFLLLDAPGHCTGHMLGLARVTASPKPAYVLLAGDTVHHPALLRPSPFLPLPAARHTSLPAALKDVGAPAYDRPFLDHPTTKWCAHEDMDVAKRTAACVQAFDAHPDVLVLLAHDGSLGGVIETFPSSVDGWKEKGWKEPAAWAFLEPGNAVNRWQE